jgi:hypothetical protein
LKFWDNEGDFGALNLSQRYTRVFQSCRKKHLHATSVASRNKSPPPASRTPPPRCLHLRMVEEWCTQLGNTCIIQMFAKNTRKTRRHQRKRPILMTSNRCPGRLAEHRFIINCGNSLCKMRAANLRSMFCHVPIISRGP